MRGQVPLLFGFAGAFRHSELVAPNTCSVETHDEGVKATIEQHKTGQDGQRHVIAVLKQSDSAYCPVQVLMD